MTRPSAVRNVRSAAAVSHRVAPVAKRSSARGIVAQAAPSATSVKYVAKQIPGDIGEAINAVRFLSIDGVNAANSGHPGLPMGCAPMASILFSEYMKLNPEDPKWADRDRFVLSAGHGSMLQYSLLHLLGYKDMTVSRRRMRGLTRVVWPSFACCLVAGKKKKGGDVVGGRRRRRRRREIRRRRSPSLCPALATKLPLSCLVLHTSDEISTFSLHRTRQNRNRDRNAAASRPEMISVERIKKRKTKKSKPSPSG